MIILWIGLVVGWAVMAITALRSLEHERRSFLTNPGWRLLHGGPQREGNTADRLRYVLSSVRHTLSSVRDRLASMTVRHEAQETLPPRISTGEIIRDWVLRHFEREHAARVVLRAMSAAESAPSLEAQLPTPHAETPRSPEVEPPTVPTETSDLQDDRVAAFQPVVDTVIAAASAAGEGIVRVDAGGQLRFPDAIARELLCWTSGERTLSDILAGGGPEASTLLESVATQEAVEQNVTVLTGGSSQQLHVTALASPNRDGNPWGALLILRRR